MYASVGRRAQAPVPAKFNIGSRMSCQSHWPLCLHSRCYLSSRHNNICQCCYAGPASARKTLPPSSRQPVLRYEPICMRPKQACLKIRGHRSAVSDTTPSCLVDGTLRSYQHWSSRHRSSLWCRQTSLIINDKNRTSMGSPTPEPQDYQQQFLCLSSTGRFHRIGVPVDPSMLANDMYLALESDSSPMLS